MSIHQRLVALGLLILGGIPLFAQAGTASITGVVNDAQGAVVPNAKITLTNEAQGTVVRELQTGAEGAFFITPVNAGVYSLTVEMPGFKQFKQTNINVSINDRLGLPPIKLEVGAVGESIAVEASAIQLETVTAERSGLVTGKQIVDIALNGRNFTSMMKTIPGSSADCTGAGLGCTFNGQRTDQNNYTVDGQNVTDIGVNAQFAYRVNVDAIQEVKVSTNGQNAEFGRNSGAQIQVVTKSGQKQFHGTGWWFKRGEFMNANDFVRNFQGLPRQLYRFTTAGFTASGPVYIPGKFNENKDKLFFFMSNEWQRAVAPNGPRQITVPTALERQGIFSRTIIDPLTRSTANPNGSPFANNTIPSSRFNQYGPSVLNWLPLPNISGSNFNYQSAASNSDPSYDQVYRGDYNITDKWRFWARHLNSKQTQVRPYGRADTTNVLGLTPFYAPTYGWSIAAHLDTIIAPTMTNSFQFGYSVNGIPGDGPVAGSPYLRSVSNINIPLLYPNADPGKVIPNFNFGGTTFGSNGSTSMTGFAGTPYANRNPIWNFTDDVAKTLGNHNFKAGFYFEYAVKTENAFKPYNGTIDFSPDTNNPSDSGFAYSNALLGNFTNYTQINKDPLPNYPYRNIEFYGQDSWKVSRKLTLNYGLRVSWIQPFYDRDNFMANFDYNKYSGANAVKFYYPTLVNGATLALNPLTGQTLPRAFIGAMLPGVGDINNGMVVSGQNGTPRGLIENRGLHWAPRFGLAYQLGPKTVLRAGGGVFYERVATFGLGITSNYTTNPPTLRQANIPYGNLSTIQSTGETFFPATVTRLSPDGHVPTVYNYNLGIQHQLPMQLFLDASYVGSQSRHLYLAQPFNNVPFGSAWQPYSQDPTVTPKFDGTTNLAANLYRPIPGYTAGNDYTWGGSANYNAMQLALNRRARSVQFGVAYTWSKALGVIQGHLLDARAYNYGPLALDRTQSLTFNYIYDIPGLSRKGFLDNKAGQLIFNGWQLSGLTSMSVGAPVNVTYQGATAANLNRPITGSEDNAPRVRLTCNPNLSTGERNLDAFVNTSCFAPALKGSVQADAGLNRLRGPGVNQWDMNLFKNITVNAERNMRLQLRLEAYNAFNHVQWASFLSTATFDAAGKVSNLPTQLGGTGGRLGFGALNATRANSQRILQIAAKFIF